MTACALAKPPAFSSHKGGYVAIRKTKDFNIQTTGDRLVQGISYQYCCLMQRGDGYSYHLNPTI